MPSFDDEDDRLTTQRAVRRMRQMFPLAPRDSHRDPRENGVWSRSERSPLYDLDEDDEEQDVGAEGDKRRPRGTPSVSFSEPVETPVRRNEPIMTLETPSPSSPSARVARRGRNRLETRLAELQRDVANLSMRLRASSVTMSHKSASFNEDEDDQDEENRVPIVQDQHPNIPSRRERSGERVDKTNVVTAKSPARTILKKTMTTTTTVLEPTRSRTTNRVRSNKEEGDGVTKRNVRPVENGTEQNERPLRVRQTNGHAEPPKSTKEMLRVVRELRVVAVERDQLRYELDQTKRSLAALEKRYNDAAKWKDAYDKIKAHCDSLQESLDLSEKIRVRQKRLLQQLQQTVQQEEAAKTRSRSHRVDVLDSVLQDTSTVTATTHQPRRTTTRQTGTTQAPSRSVSTRTGITKPSTAAINTSTRTTNRSAFDSLLQIPLPERSIAGSTVYRRTTQPKEPIAGRSTMATRTTRTKPAPTAPSTSRITTQTTRTNHFLAPTQSSLSHMAPRRRETSRPPFVV